MPYEIAYKKTVKLKKKCKKYFRFKIKYEENVFLTVS